MPETISDPAATYQHAFLALLGASRGISFAMADWHKAMKEAEAAWEAVPENKRMFYYAPDLASPQCDPRIEYSRRPPNHVILGEGVDTDNIPH